MTTDSRPTKTGIQPTMPPAPPATGSSGPSIHVVRARKLLYGGLAGGVGAAVVCLVVFTLVYGTRGLFSAGLAAVLVLFFYAAGQYVMVRFADAGARLLLSVALASYTTRVVLVGLVLVVYARFGERWPALVPMGIFLTTIAVVVGWLVVEVWVFSRLRVGVYDTEYVPPSGTDDAA